MNILIQFLGVIESGPVFTYEIAKGLVQNGNEVYAVLNNNIENKEKWIALLSNEKIFFFETWLSKSKIIMSGMRFIQELYYLYNKFKTISFDYAVRTFVGLYDELLSKVIKTKKIVNFCHDPIPHSGISRKVAEKNKRLINHADKIVVLSKSFIPVVEKEYRRKPEDIIFIKHGLLPYSEYESREKREYKKEKGICFLFFGRIDPYKGIEVLLRAFKFVNAEYKNTKLIIAGKGDFSKYQKEINEIENMVLINRYIEAPEVDYIFSQDNIVLILPYKDATQSGVATVAFDYEVPIIASDTGGLREQLFDGQVGLLVTPNDEKKLAAAMEQFLIKKNLYNSEVAKMKLYRKKLTWDVIACDLIKRLELNK